MDINLNGKIALVTGSGRGIGRNVSLALGRSGAHVILAARSQDQISTVAEEIRSQGGKATAVPCDLEKEEDIVALFRKASSLGSLDILINNAGIGIFGKVREVRGDDLDRIFSVNVKAVFLCCREALKIMEPVDRGYIINIASIVGIRGYPNQSAYTASKHGVVGLTKSLAAELSGSGIRVSMILPGGVDTGMIAMSRPDLDRSILMQPEDISQTVLYLLSLSERAAVDQIYIRRRTSTPFLGYSSKEQKRQSMNTIEIRIDFRVSDDIYEFLEEESRLKKLSFEGLLLLYIQDKMKAQGEQ